MGYKLKVASWIAIGALAGALTTMQLQAVARGAVTPLPLEQLQRLAAVYGIIKSDFVKPVDSAELLNDAISGMVAGLDPHSQFLDPRHFREFREGTAGRFVGVGIEISMEDGLVKVVSPIEGSPAFRAGLMANDLISQIDDAPVRGMTIGEAVRRMRGEPNTQVRLMIMRRSENRSFSVTITRQEIRTQSVRSRMVEPGFAWVRVSQFQERTIEDFARQVQALYQQDPQLKGFVLDLRNDPGGLLDAAVAMSAAFLPENVVVVTTNGQLPESRATFRAAPRYYLRSGTDHIQRLTEATQGRLRTVPLVVLVNEGSASASEIVAGALQDHRRATIMGSQTFGKGSVQTVRPLGPDTAIKLTTAHYFSPSGRAIQDRGILPDVWLDETAAGDVLAALRPRQADISAGRSDAPARELTEEERARERQREQEREAARQRLEEQQRLNPGQRLLPEFGSAEDFQLRQALNHLQNLPVQVSQTRRERPAPERTRN